MELMKKITIEVMKDWEQKGQIDIIKEATDLLMRVILACAFNINDNPEVE